MNSNSQTREDRVSNGDSNSVAKEPKSIAEHWADARIPSSILAAGFVVYFLVRSLSDTFLLPQSKHPVAMPLSAVVANGGAVNQFVSLSEFKLDDRKHLRQYSRKHAKRQREHLMDVCVLVHPSQKVLGDTHKYNCILKLTLSLSDIEGGTRRVQAENIAVAKRIFEQKELIGTLYTDRDLHKSVFQEFPELRRGETLVLDYGKMQKNHFLMDGFLGIVCMLCLAGTLACWTCWAFVDPLEDHAPVFESELQEQVMT